MYVIALSLYKPSIELKSGYSTNRIAGRVQWVPGNIPYTTHTVSVSSSPRIAVHQRWRAEARPVWQTVTAHIYHLSRISGNAAATVHIWASLAMTCQFFCIERIGRRWTVSPIEPLPSTRIWRGGTNKGKTRLSAGRRWRTRCTHSPHPPKYSVTACSQPISGWCCSHKTTHPICVPVWAYTFCDVSHEVEAVMYGLDRKWAGLHLPKRVFDDKWQLLC